MPRSRRPAPVCFSRAAAHTADDPGGVGADLGHVEELDGGGVVAERVAEQVQPGPRLGDDHGLVALEALAHERQEPGQEVVVPAVEQRLVLEAGRPARFRTAVTQQASLKVTGASRSSSRTCHIRGRSGEAPVTSRGTDRAQRPAAHRARTRQPATSRKSRPLRSRTTPSGGDPGESASTRASRSALKVSTLPASTTRSSSTKTRNERHLLGAAHQRVHGGDVGQRVGREIGPVGAHRGEARSRGRCSRRRGAPSGPGRRAEPGRRPAR